MTAPVYVGPAGWSYEDWKGVVYPPGAGRDFDPLEYLARYFDVVEINTSFYRPLQRRWAHAWLKRVEDHPEFRFSAKLWRRFTHERDEPPGDEDVAAVRDGLDPLAAADRLLAVLVQFPWSFKNEPESRRWLAAVVETFADYPLVLEVRHASWEDPEALSWLAEHDVGLAAIDQPLHDGSLGRAVYRTARRQYFRFHGRNFEAWFAEGRPAAERYDYLYDEEELAPWVDALVESAADPAVEAVIAITNNHYRGKAVVNALQLEAWTRGARVSVPEALHEAYPEALAEIAEDPPEQPDLFAEENG